LSCRGRRGGRVRDAGIRPYVSAYEAEPDRSVVGQEKRCARVARGQEGVVVGAVCDGGAALMQEARVEWSKSVDVPPRLRPATSRPVAQNNPSPSVLFCHTVRVSTSARACAHDHAYVFTPYAMLRAAVGVSPRREAFHRGRVQVGRRSRYAKAPRFRAGVGGVW